MLPIHAILHPTDFSPPAEGAFHLAVSLARDHGARLIALHVRTLPPLGFAQGEMYVPTLTEEEYLDKLKVALERMEREDPTTRDLKVETFVLSGDPAAEIVRLATETACDMIVMGTHGRRGLERLLMGSVAEQVLRKAPCAVLAVKQPFAEETVSEKKVAVAAAPAN